MNDDLLISHSMRAAWKQCERKVFYRYVAGIEPRQPPNPARIIGSAFHRGLEEWRKEDVGTEKPINLAIAQLVAQSMAAGMSEDSLAIEGWRLRAYLTGYFERFAGDLDRPGSFQVEAKLTATGEIGFVDSLWKDHRGNLWIHEDKTTSQFQDGQADVLLLDEQLLNYALLLQQAGHRVAGAIFRQTLKTKKGPLKNESPEIFGQRILQEYTAGLNGKYREFVVTFDPLQMHEYIGDKAVTDADLRNRLIGIKGLGSYRRNSHACMGKYGPCDYLHLCAHRNDAGAERFKSNGKDPKDGGKFRREIWGESYEATCGSTGGGSTAGDYSSDDLPDFD